MQIKKKPYNLLLFTAILLILVSLLSFDQKESFDFQLNDSYYVIAHANVSWLLTTIAFLFWVLYWITNKILGSIIFTWAHVILTIFTLLFLMLKNWPSVDIFNLPFPGNHKTGNWSNYDAFTQYNKKLLLVFIAIFAGQGIFLINLIMGLLKRKA